MITRDVHAPAGPGDVLQRAQQLLEAGSLHEALPLLEQTGKQLLLEHQDERAARVLIAAARLAGVSDRPRAEALLVLAEAPAARAGGLGELWQARAELRSGQDAVPAWQRAAAEGRDPVRRAALLRLATLARAADDPAAAAARYGELLELASVRADPAIRADLLVERAICRFAAADSAGATLDLQRAEALTPGPSACRARILGQRALMAARGGDPEGALRLAHSARAIAVTARDVMSYLPSCLMIASLHLEAGREVAAYDALVRARVSLKDLLGSQGEELVKPALAAFAERLGPRFDEVRDQWIAARQREKPHERNQPL